MKNVKYVPLLVIFLLAGLIGMINPLGLDTHQRILFSALIVTVALWATSAVHKSIACVFFLGMTMVFGKTPLLSIVQFAWSDTNLLIVTTTLLSVGIMKTGIVHKYVEKLLKKYSSNIFMLLIIPYIFGILLIFLIPQAFARVIIMGTIFNSLLVANTEIEKKAKQVLIFNAFIAITMTYMFFNNGDIVLNYAAIGFGGEGVKESLNFTNWFKLMSVPTFVTCVISIFLVYFIFKKELSGFSVDMLSKNGFEGQEVSRVKQQISVISMIVIIGFWTLQKFHTIPAWLVALIGVIIMFFMQVLKKEDLKSVNVHFIVFLMTVFSIGKILGQSGITAILFEHLKVLIPNTNSEIYLIIISLLVMILHSIIGSSVATMSVVLPILIPLTQSLGYRPEIITLLTYIIVNIHFLLPFNHATVMIGTAREYYPENYMLRFGIYMTGIVFLILFFAYFKWWEFLHVL